MMLLAVCRWFPSPLPTNRPASARLGCNDLFTSRNRADERRGGKSVYATRRVRGGASRGRENNWRALPPRRPAPIWDRQRCIQHTDADDRSDMHLNDFLGPNGLQYLLAMLDVGRILDPSAERLPAIPDLPSFVEVFRRLHIPFYEEARLYFGDALQDGYFADHNEVNIFLPETCKAIIERYENR